MVLKDLKILTDLKDQCLAVKFLARDLMVQCLVDLKDLCREDLILPVVFSLPLDSNLRLDSNRRRDLNPLGDLSHLLDSNRLLHRRNSNNSSHRQIQTDFNITI